MNFSSPYSVLLSDSIGSLLAVLAKVTRPMSGRELERMSGVKHPTALRALRRLTEHGLVTVDEVGAGAALLYKLNRNHVAAEAALILVGLNRRLRDRLTQEVSGWFPAPKHVSMFGSAARGDGGASSDVDLLIVRPSGIDQEAVEWREQLDHLPRLVLGWTGNHAGIIEISEEEAGQMALSEPRVVGELKRDAVTIHGPPVSALFEV